MAMTIDPANLEWTFQVIVNQIRDTLNIPFSTVGTTHYRRSLKEPYTATVVFYPTDIQIEARSAEDMEEAVNDCIEKLRNIRDTHPELFL